MAIGVLLAAGSVGAILAAGNADAATIGNIALHKPTSASSTRAGHPSALAVDGDVKTRWESARSGADQWIAVDLGGLYHVFRVRLVWAPACARSYQVQTSRDATTWLTAISSGGGGVGDFLLGLNETTFGRYVRVHATQPCRAGAGYALNEFELYGEKADEVPPTAAASLRVTGTTPSSVSLAWDPASDNIGIRAYAVYVNGARTMLVGPQPQSATVTGLTPDTGYTLTVVALDRAYNPSPPSNTVTARTRTGEGSPPTAPGNPRVTDVSPPCVTLAWDPSTDNVGVVGYDVTRNGDPIATVTATTVTSCGLVGNQQYDFRIVARDAAGNLSPSTAIGVTIPSA
ncbi:MAG: hypothetical protein AUI14_08505 [Actinobacteria bacterium 13_2_20CM_2_71_6]|nr:MAG: hypothetical protein AUI14_08505 [Actinobacteria bacterium 13_2_20CM_2_71_6]